MRFGMGLVLVLSIGCSGESGVDAGSDAAMIARDAGRDAGAESDAGPDDAGSDAGEVADAGSDAGEIADAGGDAGTDAGTDAGRDGGARDAGVGPGVCETTSPLCDVPCFRAVSCVQACGGPETLCGCCPCAPGSFDSISCGSGS